jgi:hypothetical protein
MYKCTPYPWLTQYAGASTGHEADDPMTDHDELPPALSTGRKSGHLLPKRRPEGAFAGPAAAH